MIVLKITNSTDVIASRVGRFLADLTPSAFDQSKVEEIVVKKLIEQLGAEGLQGELSVVKGLDIKAGEVILREGLSVRHQQSF